MNTLKKRLTALLCMIMMLSVSLLNVSAASALDSTPNAKVEYDYASDVDWGTIRYVSQNVNSQYFRSSYWGSWSSVAKRECGTSCISMALSYLGINKTPKAILNAHNGVTYFYGWGAEYSTPSFATAMSNYLNGNGKYSPPIIYLDTYASGHFVLVVGKVSSKVYQVLDPFNDSIWNITISGNTATYVKSGVTRTESIGGSRDVRQYYVDGSANMKNETGNKPKVAKYSSTKVKVSWTTVFGADGYQISYSTDKTKTNSVGRTTKNYTYIEPKKNTTCYYKVRPYVNTENGRVYGNWSNVTSFKLRYVYPVTEVNAELCGYDDVKITWEKAVGANCYAVYCKKSTADSYSFLKKVEGTACIIENLTDGMKYTFKIVPQYVSDGTVIAKGTADTDTVTTLKTIQNAAVKDYNDEKVTVSWDNIAGETGYQISRTTSADEKTVVYTYKTTDGTSKNIKAETGTTYYYRVRAYKKVGDEKIYGPWSKAVKYTKK